MAKKLTEYSELYRQRQACRKCAWLVNPSTVNGGRFDSDGEIGPWTRWQGNLDAPILLCGQDWGDVRCFTENGGLEPARSATNSRVIERFCELGQELCQPNRGDPRTQPAFFTNACLCLKGGGLQAQLSTASFRNCEPFLRRTIEIVAPRVIIALGRAAHEAICRSFGLPVPPSHRAAVDAAAIPLPIAGSRLYAVYHCAARVSNCGTRTLSEQNADWARIRQDIAGWTSI